MKAFGIIKYGEQLQLQEIPIPIPKNGEVRVKVHFAALNPADIKVSEGTVKFLHGRQFPLILGYDFSGVIEEVGPDCGDFKVGDEVFGFLAYGPFNNQGSFCESIIAKTSEIAKKPKAVSHSQAAASATTGLTSIQALRDNAQCQRGAKVLVTGTSGGVGSIAVPVALRLGAKVVAVGSGQGLLLAKKNGAEAWIDRKSQNVFDSKHGPYDIVYDAAAAYSWSQWRSQIRARGYYVTTLPSAQFFKDKIKSIFGNSGATFVNVKSRKSDLELLAGWLETGLNVDIDSEIPVREVVAGLEKLKQGKVLGRIIVKVQEGF